MKKLLLLAFTTLSYLGLSAQQVQDTVYIDPGYANQSYYSMANGEVANVVNNDWDIAFESGQFGVTIRINGQVGTELYMYTEGDTTDWSTMDTTGIYESPLFDDDSYWENGAFTRNVDASNPFDFGWGIYNPITHNVVGDSLYVIKLSDGAYKKLWIERMDAINNMMYFTYADLDGSNEMNVTFDKSTYNEKQFGYYSLQNEEELDREPAADTWDIVFTKYVGTYSPGVYYPVTGVLHNKNVMSAQANGVDPDDAIWSEYPFRDSISTIGFDWKEFDMGTFSWVLADDRAYFVSDLDSNIWKIVFTGFVGSSTGEISFTKEQVGTVGIEDQSISSFMMYPNPASNGVLNLQFNSNETRVNMNILDLSGKLVAQEQFNNQNDQMQQVDISRLHPGMYLISLQSGNSQITKKLVVK